MPTLPTALRSKLEDAVKSARNSAEKAAKAALEALAVHHARSYEHMTKEQRDLREKLRARAKQLGDEKDDKGNYRLDHLAHECAYEHWHRMLFARFLAENNLLIEPDSGMAISLDECKELAKAEVRSQKSEARGGDLWEFAGRCAQKMLPEVFRADDPLLQVTLAREDQRKLEETLDGLPTPVFTASDSLGWSYQFWQAERKKAVNESGVKIGANELPSVTQLFTEDYMVDFLLDNTLGAWWAGRCAAVNSDQFSVASCPTEEAARKACSLPGVEWKYLRFVKAGMDGRPLTPALSPDGGEGERQSLLTSAPTTGRWTPAAGTFEGWPKTAKELTCLDPCMGSGHFVVAMFERLVALRMAEEKMDEAATVAAVIRHNLFGLEIDPRCTQIAAFNLALATWRRVGHCALPAMNLACSGLAPNAKKEEWLELANRAAQTSPLAPERDLFGNKEETLLSQKLKAGMERLYQLFQKAPVLGSLINPRALGGDLLVAEFHELQPLLEKALAQETKDDTAHEMAVTAQDLAKTAEILAGQFALVATNVPYLGRGKQNEVLMDYCERVHPEAKADLATCFVERCSDFCASGGSTSLVTPQNWLFLKSYSKLRERMLERFQWNIVARLGPKGFQTPMWDFNVQLGVISPTTSKDDHLLTGIDVSAVKQPAAKAKELCDGELWHGDQESQLRNPDARITFDNSAHRSRLGDYASTWQGFVTGDTKRFTQCFWEVAERGSTWEWFVSAPERTGDFLGRSLVLRWEQGNGALHKLSTAHNFPPPATLGQIGILLSQFGTVHVTQFLGEIFNDLSVPLIPHNTEYLPAIFALCRDAAFNERVRTQTQSLQVRVGYFLGVPFDLVHWQNVAAEKYPHGLPKPFSSDPTQWLFNGHPKGADHPLQVAVTRLLGYQWPRQTGSSFPDCPALGPDGLEKLADSDGIVCIASVRGEEPAAERLRKLLAAAYGAEWKSNSELELIRATGSTAGDFDGWLRNDFFKQHCDRFHQRPFIWHIWDGRERDGFHLLINYHTLAAGEGKGRRTLETLTHSYLNDWISRQKDGVKREEEGAEERLAAALALKERLEAILAGEPPFDVFVRWKPLAQQAIGWEPDINDGVRMNIRPFLASDLPGGKKGAGILRAKPNIKWDKDRGKEPHRSKDEFPWFWNGSDFTGDRVNDVHLTNKQKRMAREKV